jgi:hypothetical protein
MKKEVSPTLSIIRTVCAVSAAVAMLVTALLVDVLAKHYAEAGYEQVLARTVVARFD